MSNSEACLYNTARRLRYMRRNDPNKQAREAYEIALKILIDEFCATGAYHELFYGKDDNYLSNDPGY